MGRERTFLLILTGLCVTFVLVLFATLQDSPFDRAAVATQTATQGAPLCRRGGYVLVLRYSGQQGAGVKALSSLQQWIRDLRLPVRIVEPYVQDSVIGIHRKEDVTLPGGDGVRFGEMFDLDHFNSVSRSEGLPEMLPWSSYLSNYLGQAVMVDMAAIERDLSFSRPVVTARAGTGCCDVTIVTTPDATSVSLCQVRRATAYWKYANTHALSSEELYDVILRGLDPSNVTIIFSLWRGPWQVEHNDSSPHLAQDTNNALSSRTEGKFRDSQKLKNDAKIYQRKFLSGTEGRYVSVMIRSEHSVLQFQAQRSQNISAELDECLEKLLKEAEAAEREVGGGILVTSDVGFYGSGTWMDTVSTPEKGDVGDIERRVKRGVERLYEKREGWSFERWEQSFAEASGGVRERGYVAALQRVLATDEKAGCLVLMGGGLYQELSLEQYLHHTRNHTHSRCVHMVCMQRKYQRSFNWMLKKAG